MKVGITIPLYHSNDLHVDFTKQTVESIKSEQHELFLYLVVNYSSSSNFYPSMGDYPLHPSVKNFTAVNNSLGNHLGGAWNMGIEACLKEGCQYVIVANNDLVFHHAAIDNLVGFAEKHPEFILWSASEWIDIRTISGIKEADLKDVFTEHPHFSCFMVNQKTINALKMKEDGTKEPNPGCFDENIQPAYFEDQDMAHRIYRSGNRAAKTEMSKFYHYGSRTIKTDEQLEATNIRTYEKNRGYFKKKWGYDPHQYCPQEEKDRLKISYANPFNS